MTRPVELADVSRITDQLWIGGDCEVSDRALAGRQLDELVALGITDIVDVRLEWSDEEWVLAAKPDLSYFWLGIDDAGHAPPDEWFQAGTEHVLRRLEDGGQVLIHCHMGVNRAPSLGFAVLLALGWDPIDALDRIRERRRVAFASYAEDALDWWLRKNGAPVAERVDGARRIDKWRRKHALDVARVIRAIRLQEGV